MSVTRPASLTTNPTNDQRHTSTNTKNSYRQRNLDLRNHLKKFSNWLRRFNSHNRTSQANKETTFSIVPEYKTYETEFQTLKDNANKEVTGRQYEWVGNRYFISSFSRR